MSKTNGFQGAGPLAGSGAAPQKKKWAKTISSILGVIASMMGLGASVQGCETAKLYGPAPVNNECCHEFNQSFYERCMDAYEHKGVCIADELRKEQNK